MFFSQVYFPFYVYIKIAVGELNMNNYLGKTCRMERQDSTGTSNWGLKWWQQLGIIVLLLVGPTLLREACSGTLFRCIECWDFFLLKNWNKCFPSNYKWFLRRPEKWKLHMAVVKKISVKLSRLFDSCVYTYLPEHWLIK